MFFELNVIFNLFVAGLLIIKIIIPKNIGQGLRPCTQIIKSLKSPKQTEKGLEKRLKNAGEKLLTPQKIPQRLRTYNPVQLCGCSVFTCQSGRKNSQINEPSGRGLPILSPEV